MTDLHEMATKPGVRSHGAFEVDLIADLTFPCEQSSASAGRVSKKRTQVGPVERLVGQPDLEPSSALVLVKRRDGETCAVDCDRVADVAVIQDGCGICYGETAASSVGVDVHYGSTPLNLDANDVGERGGSGRRHAPVQ